MLRNNQVVECWIKCYSYFNKTYKPKNTPLKIKEENIRLIFGVKVKQLRTEKKMSLADVSKATSISISYLNEIEKGKKYPKPNKIAALAQTLEVDYDWLISLQLSKKLAPIAELIQSDMLTSLPLEIFGIELSTLIDMITNTPTKVSAFISTLIEIARNYDMSVERFYFSVLRSYQEMHENYFEDLEKVAEAFSKEMGLNVLPLQVQTFESILKEKYRYEIDRESIVEYPVLKSQRSVFVPSNKGGGRLLLNAHLSESQTLFTLGKELGYNYLKLQNRFYTSSTVKVDSFEQILNNFKASYFANALLMPAKHFVAELKKAITLPQWYEAVFLGLLDQYQASPEMFLHRLTNLVPRFFGLKQLFFLRFHHAKANDEYELNKELHLAGLYNPHGNMLNEHYCRRWVSINILKDLEKAQSGQLDLATGKTSQNGVICSAQRSQYIDSENEYLCISLARAISPTPNTNSSVTIGFLMTKEFKRKVKFWNDEAIPVRQVGVACERCTNMSCQERAAEPLSVEEKNYTDEVQLALEELKLRWG